MKSQELAAKLRPFGTAISMELLKGTQSILAPLHAGTVPKEVTITRDARYGAHERNRLDVFAPAAAGKASLPVLMFVHGGGFVMGDKTSPGSPFYDNIGLWAAKNGFIGVTMTFASRLK